MVNMPSWNDVVENPPLTVTGWDAQIKEAGLHIKWPEQLREIHDLQEAKIPRLERQLAEEEISPIFRIVDSPDRATWETVDRSVEKAENIANLIRKIKRGKAVKKLCRQEERIKLGLERKGQVFNTPKQYRRDGKRLDVSDQVAVTVPNTITRSPIGTTYFADSDSGSNGNDGLGTGTAWADFAQYTTTTARSAGDILVVRRGTTATYEASDALLNFDESGTPADRIHIKADNLNAFGDDVDLSVTATATLTFGSKTVTYASDISGVLAADDVIYVAGDDSEVFAYEVESVSTVTATLYLPYKGDNDGSGKTTTNMGTNPVFGATTHTQSRFFFNSDNYWSISGIHMNSNTTQGLIDVSTTQRLELLDMVLESGSSTNVSIDMGSGSESKIIMRKSRIYNSELGIDTNKGANVCDWYDCLYDANSASFSRGYNHENASQVRIEECEFKGYDTSALRAGTRVMDRLLVRNCTFSSTAFTRNSATSEGYATIEDFNGTIGDSRVYNTEDGADLLYQSDTGTVRSGGSNISIKVTPTAVLLPVTLLEIPIKHDTSATTYTIYVKTNATANWTADPTAFELELAFEAWGHATNNHRKMNLSTDVADFNGTTDWEPLAVTVTAAQAGQGYLTLKYRKPKESAKSNEFFVDPIPEFS